MSGGVTAEALRTNPRRQGFAETELERIGLTLETGAPVTAAVLAGPGVAAGFGDGTVRFLRPDAPPVVVEAHRGAVLSLAPEGGSGAVVTGSDDGRFLRLAPDGGVEEIASFGTRWVDCVAAGPGWLACSSGRTAHVWRGGKPDGEGFEHPSTVGGLAFDPKARRLAVAHYGGATVWERGERRWKAQKLVWKGSHNAVAFSPDGKYVVTAMQENALHGWRLRDRADMRMSGYPAKVKNFVWMGDAPFLATSGADEAICWPFDDKDGPMGRGPATCCYGGKQVCTAVADLVGHDGVFAGFVDGSVLAGRPSRRQEELLRRGFAADQRVDETTLALSELGQTIAEIAAALAALEVRLDKAVLRAPFAGEVASRAVDEGAVAAAGAPVVTLQEAGRTRFRVGLDPRLAASLPEEAEVVIARAAHPARLHALLAGLDPATRTRVALFDLAGEAPSHETGSLVLAQRVEASGAWVPVSALSGGVRGLWTLTVAEDGVARPEAVEIVHANAERAYVRGTFADGAFFVVRGAHRLVAGQRVAPSVGAADAAGRGGVAGRPTLASPGTDSSKPR